MMMFENHQTYVIWAANNDNTDTMAVWYIK